MEALFSRLARFGVGLAVAGGVINSALYNGKIGFAIPIGT